MIYSSNCKKLNIFLHSPAEPFEKYKNLINSFLVSLSNPSAILFEIDNKNIEPLEHLIVCMLGEFGEFSNLVKKVKRGDFTLNEVKEQINEEFIDIFIYLIKVSNQLNINIENEYLNKMSKNKLKFEKFLK